MTAECIRRMNWAQLRDSGWLNGKREEVLAAWREQGHGTTRELSRRFGIDLLTFRPRTTDLLQAGFLRLVKEIDGEGMYEAVPEADVMALFERRAAEIAAGEQLQLKIGD